jgi:hypothetical protein
MRSAGAAGAGRRGRWRRPTTACSRPSARKANYALFALVFLHAFFYGALLRMASPFTILLIVTTVAVVAGQAIGIRLWRARHARSGTLPS